MIVTLNLNRIIVYAQEEAERLHSSKVDTAHFMLAILRLVECSAYNLLLRANFSPEDGKSYFEQQLQYLADESGRFQGRTSHADRILRIAEGISREYHSEMVCSAHMLLAILRERINKTAAYLEREWKISFNKIVDLYGEPHETIAYTQDRNEESTDINDSNWQPQREAAKGKKKTTALDKYGRDLTKLAEEGKLDPVVGRENEIERVVQRERKGAAFEISIGIAWIIASLVVTFALLKGVRH